MPVYLIQAGENGPVKIGFSNTVLRRVGAIQTSMADQLTILRILDGGLELEAALHARFRSSRVRGEWFSFTEEMLGDLGAADLSFRQSRDARNGPWSPERHAAAIAAQIALHADPVRKEARAEKIRETTAKRKFLSVRDAAKRVGSWQKMADAVGLPVTEVVTWRVIPVRYLECVAKAANVPVMKLSEIAERAAS